MQSSLKSQAHSPGILIPRSVKRSTKCRLCPLSPSHQCWDLNNKSCSMI
nr:MAG TPA: hypothetical protein [Caudoviricetes sp.]